jgi:phytoene dehydrogenase-like protein
VTASTQHYDAIIIGAGHNGLITASYLAKAGRKVLLLERRAEPGGFAVSAEIYPGFHAPAGAHLAAALAREVISDLSLQSHGLEMLPLEPLVFAPLPGAPGLVISSIAARAAVEIGRRSRKDAAAYVRFCAQARELALFLRAVYGVSFPDNGAAEGFNLGELVKLALSFHRLGEKDMYEFLRILPMSIGDLLQEWFETDLLRAAIAAPALLGSFVGPRQQGTAFSFLHHQIGASNGALRTAGLVRGGMGRLAQALISAARHYGAVIRTGTEVKRIITPSGVATGVALASGEEIGAGAVISSVDVKTTFLRLVEPTFLDPHFLWQVKNIRARGTAAKINLALDALPKFAGAESAQALGGVIHIGPGLEYLERASDAAKYGRFSDRPFLEITIPSLCDASLAPPGKHVMSIWMQYAPYELRDRTWDEEREALGDVVINLLEDYAPGIRQLILQRQVLTPLDLERTFGASGGHMYHAEMALDQLLLMRPLPGWARYSMPIPGLYLCGSGTHPGGGITGLPGYYAAREILRRI